MPYLSFNGNCEEAFIWYADVFDGKIAHMSYYGDVFPSCSEKVMHSQIMLTEVDAISGADSPTPVEQGNTLSIHYHFENRETATSVFKKLSLGGAIISDLTVNPPPDNSGMSGCIKDKFGFTWIISTMF